MVSTRTPTPGVAATMARVASMPFITGICTSMTTTSGRCSAASATASAPSAARATTSIPGSGSSSEASPSRKTGWSSATEQPDGLGHERLLSGEAPAPNGSQAWTVVPPARRAADLAVAAELLGALAQRQQSDAGDDVGADAAAVVGDVHGQRRPVAREGTSARRRIGVPHDVGEGLRDDPVRRDLDRRRQPGAAVGSDGDVDLRAHPFGLLPDRRLQPEVVEGGRAQVVDETAYVVERVGDLGPRQPDQLPRARGVGLHRVAGGVEPQRHPAEDRPEPVVEVAADPAPVVLAAEHQPLPALLHLRRQQSGADRDRRLPHQVDQQPLVAPGQHRADPEDRAGPAGRRGVPR